MAMNVKKFDEWQEIIDEIESVPAADTAEVQRGHWEFPIFTDSDDGLDPPCEMFGMWWYRSGFRKVEILPQLWR